MNNALLQIETSDEDDSSDDFTPYIELPAPIEHPIPSFCDVFKKISGLGIPMGLSFTFSFEVFLAIIFLQLLSQSEEETAAATLVSTWMNTICIIFMGPLLAVGVDLSGKLGAWREEKRLGQVLVENEPGTIPIWNVGDTRENKKEKIETTNIFSLLIAGVMTVPTTFFMYYSGPILTYGFGQNSAVAYAAQGFLRPFAIAIPGLFPRMGFEQVILSFGKTTSAMWMALASFAVGGSLSALLGFGANVGSLTIPRMGPEGVAIGFAVESYLTALAYGLFIKLNEECREFNFFTFSIERLRRNLDEAKKILRLGASITSSIVLDLVSNLSVALLSGAMGVAQQAAMSYCLQLVYLEFIFTASFGFSCAQEMRREMGAKRFINAKKIGEYGLLTSASYLTPLSLVFSIYPKGLEAISGHSSEAVTKILGSLAPIMFTGNALYSVSYNLLQQSRALNDLLVPNIISLVGISAGVGLSAGLGLGTSLGINGVGAGYTIGVGGTIGAFFWRWRNTLMKVIREDDTYLEHERPTERRRFDCPSAFFCCLKNKSAAQIDSDAEELSETFPLLING